MAVHETTTKFQGLTQGREKINSAGTVSQMHRIQFYRDPSPVMMRTRHNGMAHGHRHMKACGGRRNGTYSRAVEQTKMSKRLNMYEIGKLDAYLLLAAPAAWRRVFSSAVRVRGKATQVGPN